MSSENMLLWKTVLIVLGFKSHTSYIYFLINVLTSVGFIVAGTERYKGLFTLFVRPFNFSRGL